MKYFLLLVLAVDSMQRCSHPQSDDGGQVREGCLLRTCKDKVWRSSLASNICCYDGKPYTINTTISYTMSEDGCAKAAIDCVEETPGNTKMVLSVKNNCEDYATKDQQEDIKEMMVDTMKAESVCQEENVEMTDEKKDPKVLLIGPGGDVDGGRSVDGEVLSLPDLTPLDCNIPVFPGGDWGAYIGRSTSDGVLMCGGYVSIGEKGDFTSSCYLLTSSGYQDMPGLINKRAGAASVVTPLGLWVTGGYDGDQFLDTTEIWSNNQSQPHVRLPEGLVGHCLTSLNTTHQLLTGGYTGRSSKDGYPTAAAYIFSEEDGFTRIEDMKTPRYLHGCSVINDSTVIVAGGQEDDDDDFIYSTEYLDLNSLMWAEGPELPETVWPAKIFGPEELGLEVGGILLLGKNKIFKLEEEGLAQTRQWTKVGEMKYSKDMQQAFVVNQNMFC